MVDATKAERFAEYLRRLKDAPPASDFDEAYALVCDTLNAVEDEMTSIPYDPARWQTDGRMYPPQMDNCTLVPGRDDLSRFRTRRHYVYVATNGAIAVQEVGGSTLLTKPGSDGREIS